MGKYTRIIARLDIKGPNLVKGISLEGLRFLGNPDEFANEYYVGGADELIYMDVVASLYGRNSLAEFVKRTAERIFIPLTVGGGIRTIDDIRVILRSGADKISINTAAVKRPELITEAARVFGSQCVVVTIEAKRMKDGSYEAFIDNGRERTGLDALEWARRAVSLGAGELLVTSVDNEGKGKGFDTGLVAAIAASVDVPVIAHGGAGRLEHFKDVIVSGKADAVAAASVFHYYLMKNKPGINKLNPRANLEHLTATLAGDKTRFANVEAFAIADVKSYLLNEGISCRGRAGRLSGAEIS